jgi:radical SAM superfamily enzyme YgiQ (UPF0313 family)
MARLRTLHKRRKRQIRLHFELYKMYLYLIAMDEVVSKHTWEIEKITKVGVSPVLRLFFVGDDFPKNMAHVRIKTTYKDNRGRFYCAFPVSMEMVDSEDTKWQEGLLARVPYMLVNFLIKHPTKVPELRPIVKAYYK